MSAFDELGQAIRADDVTCARAVLAAHSELAASLDQPMPGGDFGSTCLLTAVYRASRWWLCESSVDKTGLFTRTCDDGTSSCVPSGSSASYRYRRWRDLEVR